MAVYTEVSDDELRTFLTAYDLGEISSYMGIAEGVENTNYLLQTTRGPFILTLYERRVKAAELPFFLELMDHLARAGVPCPVPVKARDGKTLRTLCGRPATIVSFLRGVWPRRITANHCSELGRVMASMHLAGQNFGMTRENNLSLAGWRDLFDKVGDAAEDLEKGLYAAVGEELDALGKAWPALMPAANLPAGVIHADLFPDNVFFVDGKCSGFIDFYFGCTDFLVYDIAICLNAWCFEPDGDFNITKANRLLAGYQSVRALSEDEKHILPLFARGAAMRFLLTRLYDWVNTPPGALVRPKDPREYWLKLKFHRGLTSIAAYGLT